MTEEGEKKDITAPVVKKEKPSRRDRKKKDKVKPLTKVIIRRLPPSMTEETFREQINPIPDHDFFYFVPADWSLGVMASSRAYINFLKQEDIFIFKDKFDGYVFVDNRGIEYPAVVEFAPFQGLPKNRARKRDSKSGTIETEPHYLAFLEALKGDGGGEKQESKLEFTYQFKDHKEIKSTPLLEYIATKRQEKRDERKRKVEEKRRLREEEKQKKKNQVAKQIPTAIPEIEKEAEDDIVVRAVKSRAGDKRTKKDKDKISSGDSKKQDKPPLDDKTKAAKEEKDRKRAEREQQRKLDRERKKEREKLAKTKSQEDPSSTQESGNTSVRKEVKKYSERRREQRQEKKAETKITSTSSEGKKDGETNAEETVVVSPADPPKDTPVATASEEKPVEKSNRQLKREKQREERDRQKEERQARRIRNKDRPSLQIYQPGRSRLSSTTSKKASGEDEQTPEDINPTTPPLTSIPDPVVAPPAEEETPIEITTAESYE